MKISFNIIITTISILLFARISNAQDLHLANYDANPLYLNPALTGLRLNEDWSYRFNLNYREQKGNPGGAYKTVASGFDIPLDNRFSIGEFVINNKSIGSGVNTFNLMLSGAYKIIHKDPYGKDSHNLSVGLQVGMLQRSLNSANFTYDSQYSSSANNGFDTNLPSGENYVRQSTFNFDMNMGVYYRFIDKNKKYSPFGGFSIYHLSQANQAYTDINSQTPMRFTLHGGCAYTINEEISILPQFMYMNQAKAHELNVGIMGFDKIKCTDYQPMLGLSWRVQNAVIAHLGLKYKTYTFRVSYDIYTYYLKQYGNRGLELSFIFTPTKRKSPTDLIAVLVLKPDTTIIPVDSSPKILPMIKDSAASLVPKKSVIPIAPDTAVVPTKSLEPISPAVRDSAKSITPVIPITPSVQDTTAVPAKAEKPSESAFPEIKDSAKSVIPVTPDTTLAPTKSLVPILPKVKDSAKSIAPVLPITPIVPDTKVVPAKAEKPSKSISPEIKDSVKSVIPITPDTKLAPPKLLKPVSPEIKDSAKSIVPAKRKISIAHDAPFELFQKSLAPIVSPTVNKSYRVQLGAFKDEVPLEIANKLLAVGAGEIKNMKDSIGCTVYTVGDFSTHDEAIDLKNEMIKKGFKDAFIIAVAPGALVIPMKSKGYVAPKVEEPSKPVVPAPPVFPHTPDSLFDVFHPK